MNMKTISVPVPQSLFDRIEEQAKRQDTTVVELVSLWLWDAEHQRRVDSAIRDERRAASLGIGDLPPRQDGGLHGCDRVAERQ